jgi:hypothetical protein
MNGSPSKGFSRGRCASKPNLRVVGTDLSSRNFLESLEAENLVLRHRTVELALQIEALRETIRYQRAKFIRPRRPWDK